MPATLPHAAPLDVTRYLLGTLPEAETEQLDELSVVDDGFAERLSVAETDLVDAYVRGTLNGDLRALFESHYLVSPIRRAKVAFAAKFLSAVDAAAGGLPKTGAPTTPWFVSTRVSGESRRPMVGLDRRPRTG